MLKNNFLNTVFFGKPIKVSEYNKSIMNKSSNIKTTYPDNQPTSFYDWAERLKVSSSVPKADSLDYSIDKTID